MVSALARRDLLVLVADRNMEAAVRGILYRGKAMGIRSVKADILRHPEQDSGCRLGGAEYLAVFANQYDHALLMFDREGCGKEHATAAELEIEAEAALRGVGWANRSAAVVLDPELDIWVWNESPHVAETLGWSDQVPDLATWLKQRGFLGEMEIKPSRPKEAMEAALRKVRRPRSSSVYQALAEKVSMARCTDRAFVKLKETLIRWFGEKAP
jgi:hypothetical protein